MLRHVSYIGISRQNWSHAHTHPLVTLISYGWGWEAATLRGGHSCVSSPCSCAWVTFRLCKWTLYGTCGLCNYSKTVSSRLQHVCNQTRRGGGVGLVHMRACISLSLKLASFLYFPDMTLELAVYLWSCVLNFLSVVLLELSRYVGLTLMHRYPSVVPGSPD